MKTASPTTRVRRGTRSRPLLLGAVIASCAGSAIAQSDKPPAPKETPTPPALLNTLLLGACSAMVIGVCLLPSKRGHQD